MQHLFMCYSRTVSYFPWIHTREQEGTKYEIWDHSECILGADILCLFDLFQLTFRCWSNRNKNIAAAGVNLTIDLSALNNTHHMLPHMLTKYYLWARKCVKISSCQNKPGKMFVRTQHPAALSWYKKKVFSGFLAVKLAVKTNIFPKNCIRFSA